MTDLTKDGFLDGRLQVWQPKGGYRAGADPVFLAASIPARSGEQVLELGTGVGTAILCLKHRVPGVNCTGVEVQPDLADLAARNVNANGVDADIHCADISDLPASLRQKSFDHVFANPPYFLRGQGSMAVEQGREMGRGEHTPLEVWIDVAIKRLAPRGRLAIIQRAERLPDVLRTFDERIGDIKILPLSPRQGRAAEHIIIHARKGARGGATLLAPFVLHEGDRHEKDGESYAPSARAILRDGAALELSKLTHS